MTLQPFTPVPYPRVSGGPNPAPDMDSTSLQLAALGAGYSVMNANYAGGADPTGSSDSAAALGAAVSALGGGPGYVTVPQGTYKLASGAVASLVTGQYIVCAPGVQFNSYLTGDCFRWTDTSTYLTRASRGGGLLGYPIIDGSNAGAESNAIHAGDILGLTVKANSIQGFTGTGSIGLLMDNQNYWTEQSEIDVYIDNCATLAVFTCAGVSGTEGADTSTGSFDRGDMKIKVNQYDVAYNGIMWLNGASQAGGEFSHYGNYETSNTAPSSAVLTLTGQVPACYPGAGAYSSLGPGVLNVNVEADEGNTYGPQSIHFGAAGNTIDCSGSMSFGAANLFQASNSAGTSQFAYQGPITGDSTLSQVFPNRSTFDGETFYNSALSVNGLTGATAGCRLVGAIASGTAPASGTFQEGDLIVVRAGGLLVCTAGGTPGTWTSIT